MFRGLHEVVEGALFKVFKSGPIIFGFLFVVVLWPYIFIVKGNAHCAQLQLVVYLLNVNAECAYVPIISKLYSLLQPPNSK